MFYFGFHWIVILFRFHLLGLPSFAYYRIVGSAAKRFIWLLVGGRYDFSPLRTSEDARCPVAKNLAPPRVCGSSTRAPKLMTAGKSPHGRNRAVIFWRRHQFCRKRRNFVLRLWRFAGRNFSLRRVDFQNR